MQYSEEQYPEAKGDSQHPGLLRALGLGMAVAIVVGNVIGSGIFAKPGEIAEAGRKVSAHQILQAEESRVEISAAMTEFHRSYDLLISPQLPITAFEVGIEVPKASGMTRWLDWSPFTYPFNFTGQPAACVPCGFTHEGLPVALQVVGPRYREDLVLRASHAYEKVHPFQMPRKSIETSS